MVKDIYDARIRLAAAAPAPAHISQANLSLIRDNALCGDHIALTARVEDGVFLQVSCVADGCLLCKAAAALINVHAPGTFITDAPVILAKLTTMFEDGVPPSEEPWRTLDMFLPLAAHRNRRKCVLLPFQVLAAGSAGSI